MSEKEFRWKTVRSEDEMEAFFKSLIPELKAEARAHGYALAVHGSMRRDLDLIAVAWDEAATDRETLVRGLHRTACGLESQSYQWEAKPNGRMATCFPICFPEGWNEPSLGHIDLSVVGDPAERQAEMRTKLLTREWEAYRGTLRMAKALTKEELVAYLGKVVEQGIP